MYFLHMVNFSCFLFILFGIINPLITGFSNVSEQLSLAAAVLNTVTLFLPVIAPFVSAHMESEAGEVHGQSCGIVPFVSLLRNGLVFTLHAASIGLSWQYYVTQDLKYYSANVAVVSIENLLVIVGTIAMYAWLHPKYSKYVTRGNSYYASDHGTM
jgi:hypothetical protein